MTCPNMSDSSGRAVEEVQVMLGYTAGLPALPEGTEGLPALSGGAAGFPALSGGVAVLLAQVVTMQG